MWKLLRKFPQLLHERNICKGRGFAPSFIVVLPVLSTSIVVSSHLFADLSSSQHSSASSFIVSSHPLFAAFWYNGEETVGLFLNRLMLVVFSLGLTRI
ncbi:hypothetical protein ACHQM5_006027 [Ranunculus cassubicifolius]